MSLYRYTGSFAWVLVWSRMLVLRCTARVYPIAYNLPTPQPFLSDCYFNRSAGTTMSGKGTGSMVKNKARKGEVASTDGQHGAGSASPAPGAAASESSRQGMFSFCIVP